MPMGSRALLVAALGQAVLPASGEVFKLKNRPLPGGYSLQGLAAFTVYSPEDSPVPSGRTPFVEYRNIQAHFGQEDITMKDYKSLQLTIISETDYKNNIEKGPVCNMNDQLYPKDANVTMYTVEFTKSEWAHVELPKTGTYFLLMSNCGNFSKGEVNGDIAVTNPFGYLSATDFHRWTAYVWIFVVYLVLAVVWTMLCIIWKSELIVMHGIIGFVLFLGLVESGAWAGYLTALNSNGEVADSAVCVLVMLTVLTTYTSYTFILVISQGWRMTEEVLDDCMLIKMGIFGLVWVVISYLHEGAMTHRHSYHISSKFMVMTTIPSMVINMLAFAWIFISLGSLSKTLKERSLEDQLKAITRFTTGLMLAVACGTLLGLVQILDSAGSLQVSWKYQYLADGGAAHVIYTAMVALSMWVWMPSAGAGQLGYSQPVEQNEEDGLWKEGGEDDDQDGGGNKVAPNTLGAADEDL